MTTLQEILLGELNPLWFSEFDTIIAVPNSDGEFSLKSKATFAVKESRVGLDFPYKKSEYFCNIEKAFQDRENYCFPDGMDNDYTKEQLIALRQEWSDDYIYRMNYPEEW